SRACRTGPSRRTWPPGSCCSSRDVEAKGVAQTTSRRNVTEETSRGRERSRPLGLFIPVSDSSAREIVGRQIDRHTVALQYPDVILAHLPADVGQHLVAVLELHAESRVRKDLGDGAHHLYRVARHVPVASWSYARAACGSIVSSRGGSRPRSMYDAWRPQLWHVSVTRSGASGPSLIPPRRRGARMIDRVPHEGQTRG